MLMFYPVELEQELPRCHPLYVGNFFPLKNMWWRKRKIRQALIVSVATAWYRLTRANPSAPGFCSTETFLTAITGQTRDARQILEFFFKIDRKGFNIDENNRAATQISPRKLPAAVFEAVQALVTAVKYTPGAEPTSPGLIKSTVRVRPVSRSGVISRLRGSEHEHLIPAVEWLYQQAGELTFYYRPAGRLQARDTSVWPVRAIETWPAWLRTQLFGMVVDIENAYCQFLMTQLELKYSDNVQRLRLQYPDLIKMHYSKDAWRQSLCTDVLKLEPTAENIKVVKKLVMALANGSNISPAMLTSGARSQAVSLIIAACPHLSSLDLLEVGSRLRSIVRQFKAAKRDVCRFKLKLKPTRRNQRSVFRLYFDWERSARHEIWAAVGKSGLMLHDGIDGVITDLSADELCAFINDRTRLRVSALEPSS